jgi:murein L,D-transpeptidase YafK
MKDPFPLLPILLVGINSLFAYGVTAGGKTLSKNFIADKIVVYKQLRAMKLLKGTDTVKSYRICLGSNPVGPKERQGDGRTPEGVYTIDWRKANSSYHRALHISYPGPKDRARAKKRGELPGGMIMIHGLPNGFVASDDERALPDWTDGCIAVTNSEIEELWRCIPDGTRIILLP